MKAVCVVRDAKIRLHYERVLEYVRKVFRPEILKTLDTVYIVDRDLLRDEEDQLAYEIPREILNALKMSNSLYRRDPSPIIAIRYDPELPGYEITLNVIHEVLHHAVNMYLDEVKEAAEQCVPELRKVRSDVTNMRGFLTPLLVSCIDVWLEKVFELCFYELLVEYITVNYFALFETTPRPITEVSSAAREYRLNLLKDIWMRCKDAAGKLHQCCEEMAEEDLCKELRELSSKFLRVEPPRELDCVVRSVHETLRKVFGRCPREVFTDSRERWKTLYGGLPEKLLP